MAAQRSRRPKSKRPSSGLLLTGDFVVTVLWVFVTSTFAEVGGGSVHACGGGVSSQPAR
jgi:hypothetical protein